VNKRIFSHLFLVAFTLQLVSCSSPQGASGTNSLSNGSLVGQALYHRVYQGYLADPKLSAQDFEKNINSAFLPLFKRAHDAGLYSYRPALPKKTKGCELPSEIALLTFESKDIYENIYSKAPIRAEVVAAHSIFDSTKSKSLVPEIFKHTVKEGTAYILNPVFKDYLTTFSMVAIHCEIRAGTSVDLAEVQKIYSEKTAAANIIFAISANHVIEYIFFNSPEEMQGLISERLRLGRLFRQSAFIELKKKKIGASPMRIGQGLDARWD
jgi:hypothetical protein